MGQFKPMVKMETTEPSVELKLKKGGSVKKAMGGMMGAPMGASMGMPARGGMMPVASPKRPSMAARRAAMMGMKEGGESKSDQKAEMTKMKGLEKELKSHESKPASKGHKGLATGGVLKSTKPGNYATGGVVNGQGGYKKGGKVKMAMGGMMDGGYKKGGMPMAMKDGKKVPSFLAGKMAKGGMACATGGVINTEGQGGAYRNTKMDTTKPDTNSAPTGEVKMGNAGGYKKGGATKKHFATGGAVNNSGRAVAMPAKKPSAPVSNDRQSGTFKKGGKVMMSEGGTTDLSKGAYDKSIGPSKEDMDMAKTIRSIPSKLYEGAKSLFGQGAVSDKERDAAKSAGSVTKTEKSVTVSPPKKRGGAVKC